MGRGPPPKSGFSLTRFDPLSGQGSPVHDATAADPPRPVVHDIHTQERRMHPILHRRARATVVLLAVLAAVGGAQIGRAHV